MLPIRDHNPSTTMPVVTWGLMAINVAVFIAYFGLFSNERALAGFYATWGIVPARLTAGLGYETLVTSMFLHGGMLHLGGNMLFLWIFGDNLEDTFGRWRYVGFYLLCGLGAGLMQVAVAPGSHVPIVGASGAIAGLMGGYLLLYPRARIDILIFFVFIIRIIPVPAWSMLAIWFAIQLFSGVSADAAGGGVAYWAHAGGFIVGFVLCIPVWLKRGGLKGWSNANGRPPHPEARYKFTKSRIPNVRRKSQKGPWG